MKVNGKKERKMARALIIIHLVILILVIGLTTKGMERVHTFILLVKST